MRARNDVGAGGASPRIPARQDGPGGVSAAARPRGKPRCAITCPLAVGGKHATNGQSGLSRRPGDERSAGRSPLPGAASGDGSRRIQLVVLAVCLLVVVAGVSVAVLSSAGGQAGHIADASNGQRATKAVPAQRTAPTPATSGRATTAPEVTNQGIARTALLWPPGLKHQIAHWKSGRAEPRCQPLPCSSEAPCRLPGSSSTPR